MLIYVKYFKKYWKMFFLAIAFLTVETFFDLMQPMLMSRIIDQGVAEGDMETVLRIGGLMFGVTLAGALAASTRNVLASRVSQFFGADLRSDLFKKIQYLEFESIDRFNRASLITRLTNDITHVQNFVHGMMRIFVKAPLIAIGSLIMGMHLNLRLSLILFIVFPVVLVVIYFNMRLSFPLFIRIQEALDRLNGGMREYLSGVRVVKAFSRFEFEVEKFQDQNNGLAGISTKAMRISAMLNPLVTLTINLGLIVILWVGGHFVDSGQMEVGAIMAFITYLTQMMTALMMLSMVLTMFVRAKTSAERIADVLQEPQGLKSPEPNEKAMMLPGSLQFENVSFAYGDGEMVLKNISFSCRPGERIGILGATGSGKTTLVNLIDRFYEPTEGTIKLGGVEMKYLSEKKIRDQLGVVPQRAVLFTGTIAQNLRWGNPDASAMEIEHAAQTAQIHEYIQSLPQKYETPVVQGGSNFSGGQRQRLTIARALLKSPKILIFDDSTSALDAKTERNLKRAMKTDAKGLTTLTIAQKISSVADMDKIIVLDDGTVAAQGTHSELLASSSIYQEIIASQFGKEGIGNA